MRLHRLEIQAFGPFADTVAIDFDVLSEAGLFLLSGATGAGKTSVLDAVCFALYGAVPGERNAAKRLRSDQADDTTPPRVSLEATLSGRRFLVVRSPAWRRPKKRGAGFTPQQASVVVSERSDGGWRPLTTRLDEAGHLLSGLVGMNLSQFTQVAMLPQGRFQAFLRASSDDRHRLLQQLFRTERFEQVEAWLRDRRVSLQRTSLDHERTVAGLVHRISETAEASAPPAGESLTSWGSALAESAADLAASLSAELPALREAERSAREALEAGRALADRRRQRSDAVRAHQELLAQTEQVELMRGRLDEATRARAIPPLVRMADAARNAAERAELKLVRDRAEAAALLDVPAEELTTETVARLTASAADAAAQARALLPREQERLTVSAQLEAARAELGGAELAEVRSRAAEARAAAARLPADRTAREECARRLEAGRTLLSLREEIVAAQLDLNQVVQARLTLAEELVALQQARLEGMAAEIAGRLAAGGGSCPVCGSDHHPHLATPAPAAPDATAEKVLRRRLYDAEFEQHTRATHVQDLQTQAALALQAAGTDDVDALRAGLAQADAALVETSRQAALAGALEREVSRLTELEATAAALTARLADVVSELLSALGEEHDDVASLVTRRTAAFASLTRLSESQAAGEVALRAADDAEGALAATAREAGFPDVPSAVAAVLPDDEAARLREVVDEHVRRKAAVEAVLADPTLQDATMADEPDLDVLARLHLTAAEELATTHAAERREAARATRLRELDTLLERAVSAWTPVRAELDLVSSVASFAEGKAPDNRLQMRLSAYVLAFRLSQVVDAANARLTTMSDRRYSLEHTGRRGAGERRGGLSLLVRDDWSGESRDPATLSGGETFVVSLALALGLADVIMHEVGGATLDTLFVDEGFGSLDADTLDDVMDTLDSLRDGGRVVGVVRHVAEMRDRIPTQLVVTKARAGSAVTLRR